MQQFSGAHLETPKLAGRDQSFPRSTTSLSDDFADMETGSNFVGQSTPRTHASMSPDQLRASHPIKHCFFSANLNNPEPCTWPAGLSCTRSRSHNALQHCDATVSTSQDSSPVSDSCPNGAGPPADTYVVLRRVSHVKASAAALGLRSPIPALVRSFSSLQRRLLWLVLAGLLLGGTMHGFVLWRGLAWQRSASAKGSFVPLVGSGLEQGVVGRSVTMAPADRTTEQKLGMPGDSDRLPNQPVWDASKWNFTARIDPASEQWPNTVAICSIMKSEHPDDVVQWLRYHAYGSLRSWNVICSTT
jgi:hypothetical protein